jgi:hypothetical protein
MAYSDGIAFITRPVAVHDDDMPELVDDVDYDSDDSDYVDPHPLASQLPSFEEVENMPSLVDFSDSDSDSDGDEVFSFRAQSNATFLLDSGANDHIADANKDSSEESWDSERAAIVNGYLEDYELSVDPSAVYISADSQEVLDSNGRPVCDNSGNPVHWQPFHGKINLFELSEPYNADAAYVIEGLRDMREAHSESYVLSQMREFLEHVGFPRRRSYDPAVQPDFIVDIKDEDDVGQIFMAKRKLPRFCGNPVCGKEMPENSIYCRRCQWVDEDLEAEQIAAERAEEEAREETEFTGVKPRAKPKKRITETEALGESSWLGQSLDDYWYCTACTHPSPMDYDYCGNCAGENRGVRKSAQRSGKPPPGSLREKRPKWINVTVILP